MRRGVLAGVGIVLAAALAACSPGPSAEEQVGERIRSLAPDVDEVQVEFQKDIFTQNVSVRLSAPSSADDLLVSAVEASYRAAWEDAGFEPSNVSVWIIEGDLPSRDAFRESEFVDLDVLVPYGLESCDHSSRACVISRSALQAEFGEWEESR